MVTPACKEIASFQCMEIYMHHPGTYQASFQIKSETKIIKAVFHPKELFTKFDDGEKFVMKSWKQNVNREDSVALIKNQIDVEINSDVTEDTRLFISILKLNDGTEEDAEIYKIQGCIKIKPCRSLFYSDESIAEESGKIQNRIIHFYKNLSKPKMSLAVGWLKYTQETINESHDEVLIESVATESHDEVLIESVATDVMNEDLKSSTTDFNQSNSFIVPSPSKSLKVEEVKVNSNHNVTKEFNPFDIRIENSVDINKEFDGKSLDVNIQSESKKERKGMVVSKVDSTEDIHVRPHKIDKIINKTVAFRGNKSIVSYYSDDIESKMADSVPEDIESKMADSVPEDLKDDISTKLTKETSVKVSKASEVQNGNDNKSFQNKDRSIKELVKSDTVNNDNQVNKTPVKKFAPGEVFRRSNLTRRSTPDLVKKQKALESNEEHCTEEAEETDSSEESSTMSHSTKSSLSQQSIDIQYEDEDDQDKSHNNDEKNKELHTRRKTMESELKYVIDLPDINAVELLLPKYYALNHDVLAKSNFTQHDNDNISVMSEASLKNSLNMKDELSSKDKRNLDSHVIAVIDYQKEEIERHRRAVANIAEDMIKMRRHITELQHENSELLKEVDCKHMNGSVYFKTKLLNEEKSKLELQGRVYELQKQLIKKNEMEVSYIELQQEYQNQQNSLLKTQNKLDKLKLLENTCRQQNQIIEEFEKRAGSILNSDHSKTTSRNVTFKSCNLRNNSCSQEQYQSNLVNNVHNLNDNLTLMKKLEETENKVHALNEQLYENTRQWAKEKANYEMYSSNDWYNKPMQRQPTRTLMTRSRSIEPGYYASRRNLEYNHDDLPKYSYHRRRHHKNTLI